MSTRARPTVLRDWFSGDACTWTPIASTALGEVNPIWAGVPVTVKDSLSPGLKVWLASGSVMLKIDASLGSRYHRMPTGTVAGDASKSERSRVSLIWSWERQNDA